MCKIPFYVGFGSEHEARSMLLLKRQNILHAANCGEVPLTADDRKQLRITEKSVEDYARTLSRRFDCLAARYRGQVIGFCLLSRRYDMNVQLRELCVRRRMQGKGVGSALLHDAIAFTRHHSPRNTKSIILMTGSYNAKDQAVYEHWGFRKVPATLDDIQKYGSELINVKMEYDLTAAASTGTWDGLPLQRHFFK